MNEPEEVRLRIYRILVELREAEQRAYDLFLQNLVKGTSHLSLGQEAVAAGFAAMGGGSCCGPTGMRWRCHSRARFCRPGSARCMAAMCRCVYG